MTKEIELIKGWEDLTLRQYQQIYPVTKDNSLDDIDQYDKILSIIYDITEAEISELDLPQYKKLLSSIAFLNRTPIKLALKKVIEINGRAYTVELNPAKLPTASAFAFLKYAPKTEAEVIEIMHYLLARVVRPVKKNRLGFWKKQPHSQKDAVDIYSEDMLDVKFVDIYSVMVYHIAVFMEWYNEYNKKLKLNQNGGK